MTVVRFYRIAAFALPVGVGLLGAMVYAALLLLPPHHPLAEFLGPLFVVPAGSAPFLPVYVLVAGAVLWRFRASNGPFHQKLARRAPLILAAALLPFELAFGLYHHSLVIALGGWVLHSVFVLLVGYGYVLVVEVTLTALVRRGTVQASPGVALLG